MGIGNSLPLRIISAVVLSFFLWTFCLFESAYAITNSDKLTGSQATSNKLTSEKPKTSKPEEKFQKTIDDIEQTLSDTVTDTNTKKGKLKDKKAEIGTLDLEIKKQFKETEDKIKDLPEVIKQRHRDFVKKYEDNLSTLKTNLDEIDKAKTEAEVKAKVEKARAHLEKVRPPKKHVPLDPNKLPHRTAEPVFIEPRTSPEQFLHDREALAVNRKEFKDLKTTSLFTPYESRLLVASNGSLAGLLSSPPPAPQFPGSDLLPILGNSLSGLLPSGSQPYAQSPMLLALADPPTDADLAENGIEIVFTPAIRAKAAELQYKPVQIYNWVRNNIEFVPTYGSIQGADMCLQTKQCNAFDTSSLLIALLRASGIHARYAYGTIELPIEKVKNWVGNFSDTNAALTLIASGGIPATGMTSSGKVVKIRMEHVWVEAWIDYIPSRGEIHRQGDTFIPLDPSFKQFTYTPGMDIKSVVPFDAQSFIDQIKNNSTINEAEGYVTSVNSLLIQQTMTDYQAQVQNYISQNYPNATVGDVLGKKEIIKQEFPHFMGTLQYRVIVKGTHYSKIPDKLRHKITFNVTKDIFDSELGTPINITKSLPELAGKKITLSYSPATPRDEAVINSYLPKPHTDGTPIQPNELPSSLPAYLITLKPELRIDGNVVAAGTSITMGQTESFRMTFTGPKESPDVIDNPVKAGNYLAIALDLGRISAEQMTALKTKLEQTKAKLEAQNFEGLTKDDILGDLLYITALSYHAECGVMNYVTAKSTGVLAITLPSETIFSFELNSSYAFGIPVSVSPGGLAMDADRLYSLVISGWR